MEMAYTTEEIINAVTETIKVNNMGCGLIKILAFWDEEAVLQMVLAAAPRIGISTSEDPILPQELFTADEIFTSHSGIKVLPVARFEDRDLQAPGPITDQLIKLMDDITSFRDDRFKDWLMPLD